MAIPVASRKWTRRKILAAMGSAAAIPAISLIASSCGGDETSSGSGDLSDSASPSPASTPNGGNVRVAMSGDPPNLDIHQTTDSIVVLVASHMYETLFTWDAAYQPVPLLAESHDISEDRLQHTVTLRPNVLFHNGETLKAIDVQASIERWGKISGLGKGLMEAVSSISVLDDRTLRFELLNPFGTFRVALSRQLQGCAIYPQSVIERSEPAFLAEYVGTGPYRFVEWLPDRHVLIERNDSYSSPAGPVDGYAGTKHQFADTLEFVPVRSEASRIAGMQAGDFHFVETVSADQEPVLEASDLVAVETLPADSWLNVVLNLRSPHLEDLRIRRAIQLALDHEAIMLAAFGEGFYELSPELLPGAPAWYSDAGSELYFQFDPDESKRLLEEAGYDGSPLRFMTTQEIQQEYNATLTMAQQLEAVGIAVDLQVYDGATLSDRRNDDTLWEFYTAWASFRPDPAMRNLTSSATGWWEDEEKDRLLAELQFESDFERRYEIWENVQYMFYEDVPRLKIGNSKRILARSKNLHDVGPTEMQADLSNAWLDG